MALVQLAMSKIDLQEACALYKDAESKFQQALELTRTELNPSLRVGMTQSLTNAMLCRSNALCKLQPWNKEEVELLRKQVEEKLLGIEKVTQGSGAYNLACLYSL